MTKTAALFLAHLNPFTKAHEEIISYLRQDYHVYVFPVRFLKDSQEVNTRSFPFSYEARKSMVESVFGKEDVTVLPDYTFYSPFVRYLPPIISPYSWMLRNSLIRHVNEEKFVTYTGDKAERIALRVYRLNPLKAKRLEISASLVKEMMYQQAIGDRSAEKQNDSNDWQGRVPSKVVQLIKDNWIVIEKYASLDDRTTRIFGMKFPKDGFR